MMETLDMLKRSLPALALVLAVVACDNTGTTPEKDQLDGRVDRSTLPEVGPDSRMFEQPEHVVPAGSEEQWCFVADWLPDRDYLVKNVHSFQSGMGHHLIAFETSTPRDPGDEFDCTSLESMTGFELLLSSDTLNGEETFEMIPENFAVRMKAGTQLVFQSHYVNISDRDLVVSDVALLDFVPVEEEDAVVESSWFALNHGGLDIPVGAEEHVETISCDVPHDVQMVSMTGHMHDWGKTVKIEHELNGARETIYEIDEWTVDMRDFPPITNWTEAEPLLLPEGSKLHITCTYTNDTEGPLRFPQEMCAAFGAYFPATDSGMINCD
jgi:hypothetical protein